MTDQFANHVKDWLTWALAGLGVTLAPHEWVGGIFLAMAGATLAVQRNPENDRQELWAVIGGAFFVAHMAAMVSMWLAPTLPVQVVMAVAGFFSRYVIRFGLRFAGAVEARTDDITDRALDAVLPAAKDAKDKE